RPALGTHGDPAALRRHSRRGRHDVAADPRAEHRLRQPLPELVRPPGTALAVGPDHDPADAGPRRRLGVHPDGRPDPAGRPDDHPGGGRGGGPDRRGERLAALLVRHPPAAEARRAGRGVAARDRRAEDLRPAVRHQGTGRRLLPRGGDPEHLRLRPHVQVQRLRIRLRRADHLLRDDPGCHVVPDLPAQRGEAMTTTTSTRPASALPRRRKPARTKIYPAVRGVLIVLVVAIFVLPLAWMVMASFKSNVDIHDTSKTFLFEPVLSNYTNVFGNANYGQFV